MYIAVKERKNTVGETVVSLSLGRSYREDGKIKNTSKYIGSVIIEDLLDGNTRKLDKLVKLKLEEDEQAVFYEKYPKFIEKYKTKQELKNMLGKKF